MATKGDMYTKEILKKILDEGCWDKDPRPYYEDVYQDAIYDYESNSIILDDYTVIELNDYQKAYYDKDEGKVVVHSPAHTISINNGVECNYDLSKGESPLITLRPIATGTSAAELLWIYQQESNDLVKFDELLGKKQWNDDNPKDEANRIYNWWEEWALKDKDGVYILNELGHPHIGSTYGEVIKAHELVAKRLKEMQKNPDGRRHIISMWQDDDYDKPHGLKPCAFMTIWNIRHDYSGDYLDATLIQRSSDFCTAGCINQTQYAIFLMLFARHLGLNPGVFTWKPINVQIYDRHMEQANTLLNRESVDTIPYIWINPKVKDFYEVKPEDVKIMWLEPTRCNISTIDPNNKEITEYGKRLIKKQNPKLDFPIGI